MKKKIIFIVLSILFFSEFIFSQTIKVIDASTLQPISNVYVFNAQKTVSALTNTKGQVDVSNFGLNDTIIFKHIAFITGKATKEELSKKKNSIALKDNIINLEAVVLSANKVEEKESDLPQKIDIITAKEIAFNNPQTSGDLLQQTGNVFIQQSQMGGGSPMLRGFEANKVLLVVDGVRLNNAIYRSGHLQSIITIDPSAIDRVEVVYGPGSVIYGSDALGGVMHFYTKNPELSLNGKTNVKADAFVRYASANNEKTGGFTLNVGFKKWASFTSFSYKDFDDLREGRKYNPFYGDWGKCLYYAERINEKDVMVANDKSYIQKNSGYSQYDILQKFIFQPSATTRYTLNAQFSNSSDIPRYDRLTDMSGGKLKYAEWYYGPQMRLLTSLKAEYSKPTSFYDKTTIIAAYQNISEDRISRKFDKKDKQFQEETVNVLSFNTDLLKSFNKKSELRYGIEVIYNDVASKAYSKNILTDKESFDIATRYPDDGSTMLTTSAYASHNWEINKKFVFSQGIRYSAISLNAEYSDTMMKIMDFPFDKKIKQTNSALNGSLGLVYMPGYDWRFALMGSSGFRAPNVDDIGKVNDSKSSDHLLIVPNPNLKSEYSYNLDLTIGKTINKNVHLEATGFYTLLTDAIVARPYKFNGQDSIMFDGVMCQVQANTNTKKAYLYGLQTNLLAQINSYFSIKNNLTYTFGGVMYTGDPLDHIPPMYGLTSFCLEMNKFKGEFYIRYSAWKHADEYSPSGEDNITYATVYGMPSWYTLNIKTAYQINKHLNVMVGVENILDEHYRNFASGISAPGRNFIVTLRSTM